MIDVLLVSNGNKDDVENIKEKMGVLSDGALSDVIKNSIEEINDKMPAYKRVKRFKLRNEEFEKTSTRKIRRTGAAIREDED